MKKLFLIMLCLVGLSSFSQELKLTKRNANSSVGSEFTKSIIDTSLSLENREELIFNEVKKGNIPAFLRSFYPVSLTKQINGIEYTLVFWVLPDYLAIGNDKDYFYVPTTPMLAQRIADLTKTMLPTKLMVDEIYRQAKLKLAPQPLPPTKAMTTVPVFMKHNELVREQMKLVNTKGYMGELTAGNKKDIIISNKIYGMPISRVVIYGWHKLDGKAIQPVYNKHTNTWADYSHGIRLISTTGYLNGKRTKLADVLKDPVLHELLSDEGVILKTKYPVK